ncbi:MAG: HAD hydrolase-like protein [Solobacterium sp.]|nr:HAD hydrolase-like protein [Solobacterium sp.]
MSDILLDFKPKHDLLVCIDSDGTAFDNMELKHKECFCPVAINAFSLQSVSKYFREVWEFYNLYAKSRGINRFPGIVKCLEETALREEVKERGLVLPDLSALKKWTEETAVLGCAALEKYVEENQIDDEGINCAIKWSHDVDRYVKEIVHDLKPLPLVKETLEKVSAFADIVIVSAATHDALEREWKENDLLQYVTVVAGQELGSKAACIEKSMRNKYDKDHVLMIGDAIGDYKAAENNSVLYYPIIPGREVESWKKALNEAMDVFKEGKYKGTYMQNCVDDFMTSLKDEKPWE